MTIMYVSVVTTSQSAFTRNGLTYRSDEPVRIGSLVEVPLRSKKVEGIVVGIMEEEPQASVKVKTISQVLSSKPLLSEPMMKMLFWMAEYYCCSLRQILQVLLPSPPWKNIIPKKTTIYTIGPNAESVKGAKQKSIIEYLKMHRQSSKENLRETLEVSLATLSGLLEKGYLEEHEGQEQKKVHQKKKKHSISLSPADEEVVQQIEKSTKPVLLIDTMKGDDRSTLYGALANNQYYAGKSTIILFPDIFSAKRAFLSLQKLLPATPILLIHSGLNTAERRRIERDVRDQEPRIVIGTRTALFTGVRALGLIVIDNEQEWTYKSEKTPRYHARLTAEVLSKLSHATLLLASNTPSLESIHHAKTNTKDPRYALLVRTQSDDYPPVKTHIADLTQANFGSFYPLTAALVEELRQRIAQKETSVLLLNRRGTATSLLCFDCKTAIVSPESLLPMSVVTQQGRAFLLDRHTGYKQEVPALCPKCGSANMKAVGAGTEKVEMLLHTIFPAARIVRADADTLEKPLEMEGILERVRSGDIDIVLGTQPVLKILYEPRVTFASILIADIGLSLPDFRAGERVFQLIAKTIDRMNRPKSSVLIQTFRPDAPEIALAAVGRYEEYFALETELREQAGYPPSSQIISLIIRKDRFLAEKTLKQAKELSKIHKISCHFIEEFTDGARSFRITLRGAHPREIVKQLSLQGIIVDVDPLE